MGLKEKSVKVILVGSLVGMGTSTYMPAAEAAEGTSIIPEEAQTVNSLSKLEIESIALDQKFQMMYTTIVQQWGMMWKRSPCLQRALTRMQSFT